MVSTWKLPIRKWAPVKFQHLPFFHGFPFPCNPAFLKPSALLSALVEMPSYCEQHLEAPALPDDDLQTQLLTLTPSSHRPLFLGGHAFTVVIYLTSSDVSPDVVLTHSSCPHLTTFSSVKLTSYSYILPVLSTTTLHHGLLLYLSISSCTIFCCHFWDSSVHTEDFSKSLPS